jgi:levanase
MTGTLTSPPFTVATRYLDFEIGGGRHPHDPAASTDDAPPAAHQVLADFAGGTYGTWTATGKAFGAAPATGTLPDQQQVSNWQGGGLVNTFLRGDATARTLTSPSSPFPRRT